MSRTIDILIRIKKAGEETIKKMVEDLNKFKSSTNAIDASGLKKIEESISKISNNINNLLDLFDKNFRKVSSQAIDMADNTSSKLSSDLEKTMETSLARLLVGGSVTVAALSSIGMNGIQKIINYFVIGDITVKGILSGLSTFAVGEFDKFFKLFKASMSMRLSVFTSIPVWLKANVPIIQKNRDILVDGIRNLTINFKNLSGTLEALVPVVFSAEVVFKGLATLYLKIGMAFASTIGGMIFFKFFLTETTMLVRRILGMGYESLTPIERVTRLLVTLDDTIHNVGTSTGQLFKAATFGILTFFGPFSGILAGIPFLNSMITVFVSSLQRRRYVLGAFFGSGRAQLGLIFYDLRTIALKLLPVMVKNIPGIIKAVQSFKLIENLPIVFKKFISFTSEFSESIVKKIQSIFLLLSSKLWMTKKEVEILQESAEESASEIKTKAFGYLDDFGKKILEKRSLLIGVLVTPFELLWITAKASFNGILLLSKTTIGAMSLSFKALKGIGSITKSLILAPVKGLLSITDYFSKRKGPSVEEQLIQKKATVPAQTNKESDKWQEASKSASQYIEKLRQIFLFSNLLEKKVVSGRKFDSTKQLKSLSNFIAAISNSFEKEFSQEKLQKVSNTFLKTFTGAISSDKIPMDSAKNFAAFLKDILGEKKGAEMGKAFMKALSSSLRPGSDPKLQSNMQQAMQKLVGIFEGNQIKKSGEQIQKQLAQGMEKGMAEPVKASEKTAEKVMEFNPQSPAKKGALRNLVRSGSLIPQYLAQGMNAGVSAIRKAAGFVAEKIAEYFPRSLPVVGPLVSLPLMGMKIPFYIAQGIFAGLKYVQDVLKRGLDYIKISFEGLHTISNEAKKLGIETSKAMALDVVFKNYSSSLSEASFGLVNLRKAIKGTGSGEEATKLARLGINLDEVKNSADPLSAAFLQLSDVIKNSDEGSEKFNTALELLGLTASSNLVIAMKQGSDTLKKDMVEALELGAMAASQASKEVDTYFKLYNKLMFAFDSIFQEVLAKVLPDLNNILKKVIDFVKEKRAWISVMITVVADAVRQLLVVLYKISAAFIEEPGKIFDVLWEIGKEILAFGKDVLLKVFLSLQSSIFGALFSIMKALWPLVVDMFNVVKDPLINTLEYILRLVGRTILVNLDDIWRKTEPVVSNVVVILGKIVWWGIKGVMEVLDKFAFWIVTFFNAVFPQLVDYFDAKIRALFTQVLENLSKFIENRPKLKKVLDFLGLGDFMDALKGVARDSGEIQKEFQTQSQESAALALEMAKSVGEIAANIGKEKSEISLVNLSDEDIQASKEKMTASFAEMGEKMDQFKGRIKGSSTEITEIFKETFDNLFKDIDPEQMKKILDARVDGLKAAFAKLPPEVQAELEKLKGILSPEYFDVVMQKYLDNLKKLEDESKKSVGAFEGFLGSIGAFFESLYRNMDALQSMAGNFSTMFGDLYEMSGKKVKEFFYAMKAAAMSEIIINTAKAVMGALGTPPYGFWQIGQASVIAAMGTVQLAKVAAETITGFALGGSVNEGSGQKDDVPAMLMRGEYVMPKKTVQMYGVEFMERLKNGLVPMDMIGNIVSGLPKMPQAQPVIAMAQGGIVGRSENSRDASGGQGITIVNILDPSMIGKFMASAEGKRSFLNFMSDNAPQIKRALA